MQKLLYLFFFLFTCSIIDVISLLTEFNANLFSDFNSKFNKILFFFLSSLYLKFGTRYFLFISINF